MDISTIAALIIKRLNGGLSDVEEAELQAWMDQSPTHRQAVEPFLDEGTVQQGLAKLHDMKERVWENLEKILDEEKVVPVYRSRWWKWSVAASVILMLGLGSYLLFFSKTGKQTEIVTHTMPHDIEAPRATKAMITLADGRTVALDSFTNGTLAVQGNVNVIKTADGQIIYTGSANEVVYNTLTNPRGSKVINMTLTDGSRLWLNAGSSVTYPVYFVGNERKISITGEAYFEITHDNTKPFIVSKGEMNVQVLGTHFNVNAYDDESDIKVTLLEGSVKVSKGPSTGSGLQAILKPGQQARVTNEVKVVNGVNVDEVMAWKNERFAYSNADLETIMRQMARWYDVEVVYKDKITDRYTVTTPRDVPVSQLFKYIEMSGGVHFKIEARKITVMK